MIRGCSSCPVTPSPQISPIAAYVMHSWGGVVEVGGEGDDWEKFSFPRPRKLGIHPLTFPKRKYGGLVRWTTKV